MAFNLSDNSLHLFSEGSEISANSSSLGHISNWMFFLMWRWRLKPTSPVTSIYFHLLPKVMKHVRMYLWILYACGCIQESFSWFPSGTRISQHLRLELPKTFLSTSSPTSSLSLTNKSGLGEKKNVENESLLMAMPSNRSWVKLWGKLIWSFVGLF